MRACGRNRPDLLEAARDIFLSSGVVAVLAVAVLLLTLLIGQPEALGLAWMATLLVRLMLLAVSLGLFLRAAMLAACGR